MGVMVGGGRGWEPSFPHLLPIISPPGASATAGKNQKHGENGGMNLRKRRNSLKNDVVGLTFSRLARLFDLPGNPLKISSVSSGFFLRSLRVSRFLVLLFEEDIIDSI